MQDTTPRGITCRVCKSLFYGVPGTLCGGEICVISSIRHRHPR